MDLPETVQEKEYHEGVGRRKSSTARVRIWTTNPKNSVKEGYFIVNKSPFEEYFQREDHQKVIFGPLEEIKSKEKFCVSVQVEGGGKTGQAEAIQHGLARALVEFFPNFKKKLKRAGFLTRDARVKERKKPGKRKARRSPQWQKR